MENIKATCAPATLNKEDCMCEDIQKILSRTRENTKILNILLRELAGVNAPEPPEGSKAECFKDHIKETLQANEMMSDRLQDLARFTLG